MTCRTRDVTVALSLEGVVVTVAELLHKLGDTLPVIAFCGGAVLFVVKFAWNVSREVTLIKSRLASCEAYIESAQSKKGAA